MWKEDGVGETVKFLEGFMKEATWVSGLFQPFKRSYSKGSEVWVLGFYRVQGVYKGSPMKDPYQGTVYLPDETQNARRHRNVKHVVSHDEGAHKEGLRSGLEGSTKSLYA